MTTIKLIPAFFTVERKHKNKKRTATKNGYILPNEGENLPLHTIRLWLKAFEDEITHSLNEV